MKNKKAKLGDYIEEYSVKNKQGYQYPVYSVTNSNGFCTEYFNKDVSSKDKRNYKIVPYGCFAYNPSRINVGSIDWQHYEKNVIVSPLYVVFKCSNKINQKYLQYFFESEYGKHLINSKVSGSVRANLKFSSMCEFELSIGTTEEQQKIISIIDKINKLIDAEKKQLDKLDELIKSKFNEIFGDPIDNPKKWKIKNIADVSEELFAGGDRERDISKTIEGEYKYPVFSNGETNNGLLGYSRTFRVNKEAITISARGTIGLPIIRQAKFTPVVRLITLIPKQCVNIIYLSRILKEQKMQSSGSSQGQLTIPNFSKINIILPPIETQNKFAEFVKKVENIRTSIQKQIDLYTELLNKKMEEYFN